MSLNDVRDSECALGGVFAILVHQWAELCRIPLWVEGWVDDHQRVMCRDRDAVAGHTAPGVAVVSIAVHGVAVAEESIRAQTTLEAQVALHEGRSAVDSAEEVDAGDVDIWRIGCWGWDCRVMVLVVCEI